MDMGSPSSSMVMSMSMSMSPTGSLSSMGLPSSTAMSSSMNMGSMGDMIDMGACKSSMTWNWYTIDACFLSESWHITSSGMFAGSCIGVICLVISLEFLRRVYREYNRHVLRQLQAQALRLGSEGSSNVVSDDDEAAGGKNISSVPMMNTKLPRNVRMDQRSMLKHQLIRAAIHGAQFAVAYLIMLIAMSFNGYIIICIFIGGFLGYLIFSWDQMTCSIGALDASDVTGCCG